MKLISIPLPKLGESVAEATLLQWLVQPGDSVEKDQILCELGTDKVESELPSEYAGIVRELSVQEGQTVVVGSSLLTLEVDEELVAEQLIQNVQKSQDENTTEAKTKIHAASNSFDYKTSEIGFLSPVVRKIMAENQLEVQDIKHIKRTGTNHRLTKRDIEQFLYQRNNASKFSIQKRILTIEEGDEVVHLSRMRQLISDSMQHSNREIPHVTSFVEIDVSYLIYRRAELKEQFTQDGLKLSLTHLMQFQLVQSLKKFPSLNSWFNVDEWIIKEQINLGFATALDNGNLIVPNIKSAQNLSLHQLVATMNQKSSEAKSNKLQADDLKDTTFTVSNTGIFGSVMGTPIISIPQVAILALGAIQRKAIVRQKNGDEFLEIGDVMMASLSYDHRVIDGALASSFLTDFKNRIESMPDV